MKTLKKVLVVLLSLLVLSAALFGCGAKDEPPTEPSDTNDTADTRPSPPPSIPPIWRTAPSLCPSPTMILSLTMREALSCT